MLVDGEGEDKNMRPLLFTMFLLGLARLFGIFLNISSAISRYGTTIEQHNSRRKWGEGDKKEYKVETR